MYDGTVVEAMLPIDLPPISFRTQLMWISFPQSIIDHVITEIPDETQITPDSDSDFEHLGMREYTLAGGWHGAEHAMIKMSPLELRLDNDDMGGLSQLDHQSFNHQCGSSMMLLRVELGSHTACMITSTLLHSVPTTGLHSVVADGLKGVLPASRVVSAGIKTTLHRNAASSLLNAALDQTSKRSRVPERLLNF